MQKPSIEPIWHPYWKWEEVAHNMWGSVENRKDFLQKAIELTGNHKLYGKYMMRVVKEWTYSCEHNLSKDNQNKQAWLGHAAVALAIQCPEDLVRSAWWHLTDEQRLLANIEADKAISYWEQNYVKKTNREKCIASGSRESVMDI